MSFSIQSVYNWYRNTLRNPKYRWWVILGTLVYLLSPFDIAPDFLPVVGQIDDIAIVTLLVAELSQMGIEYFKVRQEKSSEVAAGAENNGSSAAEQTVEVKASSIK
ncbi:MAG: YkvA family protein [Oscillatoria sp. Prado101]|jgi:uncharacterized membrane protein YkvA (DUF1232 family)|nr:YkvA family protein [Oscillatoria sp. Prado101]